MYQDVQKYLQFLFNIATSNEAVSEDTVDQENYTFIDQTNSLKGFDLNTIYNELTNFVFLSLLNNSNIDINDEALTMMVEKGKFERVIARNTIEHSIFTEKMKSLSQGTKTPEGTVFYDEFGQKLVVKTVNKNYVVCTECLNVISSDYLNLSRAHPRDVINIIRNNMIHNDYKKIGKESLPPFYENSFKDVNEPIYLFKDKNSNIDIILCESWLREFKKVYFNSSYFQIKENENTFYFPRFLNKRNTPLNDENDLEEILYSIIHTHITVRNLQGNYMNTRNFIEDTLFNKVLSKDKQMRYAFTKKSKEELITLLKVHQDKMKELILNELSKAGYDDVTVSFSFAKDNPNFSNYVEQWKIRINYDPYFYNAKLDEQLEYIAGSCNLRIDGGFGNKEIKNGLTPEIVSLFSSTIESTKVKVPDLEQVKIVQHYVNNILELDPNIAQMFVRVLRMRTSAEAALEAYHYLEKKLDFSDNERVTVKEYFKTYTAGSEFALAICCAAIYNGLIATQFTEKGCKRNETTNEYPTLTTETFNMINKLNMKSLLVENQNSKELYNPTSYKDKMYIFNQLRNILLHGKYYINYSKVVDNIEDTELIFEKENIGLKITASAKDIMTLFGNKVFYQEQILANEKNKS